MNWDILYRGPLDSCNYDCGYCPFAKRTATVAQIADDREKLERFVEWVETRKEARIRVLFTPWGEALIHRHYRGAITRLSRMAHVERVAIQTNLSGPLDWLSEVELGTTALWTTWHPSQISLTRFVDRCGKLDACGVRYSVGVVGLREHLVGIEQMRRVMPASVYLWVNAYKDEPDYYDAATLQRIVAVDPLFSLNAQRHRSGGRECFAGETSFTVDGDGQMFRCHFLKTPIGNIYRDDFVEALKPRVCSRMRCGCHIGYVNLKYLKLREVFGDGLLERIPPPSVFERAAMQARAVPVV